MMKGKSDCLGMCVYLNEYGINISLENSLGAGVSVFNLNYTSIRSLIGQFQSQGSVSIAFLFCSTAVQQNTKVTHPNSDIKLAHNIQIGGY